MDLTVFPLMLVKSGLQIHKGGLKTMRKWVIWSVILVLFLCSGWSGIYAQKVTLRILSLPWPQTPVEQRLANEIFTKETGIKVEIESPPYQFVEYKIREIIDSKSDEYDLFEYDSQWIGEMVLAGGLERLDTEEYLFSK